MLGVFALILVLIATSCFGKYDIVRALFYPPVTQAQEKYPSEGKTLSFETWDKALKKYVKDGVVNYDEWKKDPGELKTTLEQLSKLEWEGTARDHLLSALINAYNVFTVQLIFDNYPGIKSIRDIPAEKRWDAKRWDMGGKTVSLEELEQKIIRVNFIEPRIHFAVVCASKGCPPLASSAFEGDKLDEQLTANVISFFSQKQNLKIENNTVYVSSLLDWYKPDFIRDELATEKKWFGEDFLKAADHVRLLMYIAKYAPSKIAKEILEKKESLSIGYLEYDWSLNN